MEGKRSEKKKKWYKLAVIAAVTFFSLVKSSYATSETKEQMEQAQREKEEAEAQLQSAQQTLESTQAQLSRLESARNSYQGEMELLNGNLQLVADRLAVLESEIELKQLEISETQQLLADTMNLREEQYESMKQRIRYLYEDAGGSYATLLLTAESFGEFLNFADYIERLSAYDRQMLQDYIATEEEIRVQESELQAELAEMDQLHLEVVAEQEQVNGMIAQTAQNIAATADSIDATREAEDAYEALVDQRQAEAEAAAAEYEQIKAQYEEELRQSRLAAQSSWRDISQVTFEEGDRYLLANLIYCEAGGEPFEGQVAVGAVVINRVLSSVFPDTVTGVIYQRRQFSPVASGRLAQALAVDKATSSCYQAADQAMAGVTNVGTRVFFRTPIPGLEGLQIGGHIFY